MENISYDTTKEHTDIVNQFLVKLDRIEKESDDMPFWDEKEVYDNTFLAISDHAYEKLQNLFYIPGGIKYKVFKKDTLAHKRVIGRLTLSNPLLDERGYAGYVIEDVVIDEVIEKGYYSDPVELDHGQVEFHTHTDLAPGQLEVRDLSAALEIPDFIDREGIVHEGKKIFSVIVIDTKKRVLNIDMWIVDLNYLARTDDGSPTTKVFGFNSNIEVDLS